jgi:hypothetical protein
LVAAWPGQRVLAWAARRSRQLSVRDPPVASSHTLADLPLLASEGHTSLKLFMTSGAFETRAAEMIAAVRTAGQHGMLTLIHCEDGGPGPFR